NERDYSSLPTRRSSDLGARRRQRGGGGEHQGGAGGRAGEGGAEHHDDGDGELPVPERGWREVQGAGEQEGVQGGGGRRERPARRSEEHTSELQSPCNLV